MPLHLLLVVALLCPACVRPASAQLCPEAQGTRCMTRVECAFDAHRGCEVCRCAPPTAVPIQMR